MAETFYKDNYEEITGKKPGEDAAEPAIITAKVVEAPAKSGTKKSDTAETK